MAHAGGDVFERIPERDVAAAHPVDRKVRLEHASLWSELIDRISNWIAPRIHQIEAGWGSGMVLESEAEHHHSDAAELDEYVGARRQFGNIDAPLLEDLGALSHIWAGT